MKIYFDENAELKYLEGKTVAVIGYGIQGRAQALNMRDSKINVIVGLRPEGNSWKLAEKDGFKPYSISEAAEKGDIIHILTPDMVQPLIYKNYIVKYLKKGKVLGFSHGFNIHYKQIIPPSTVDVIMVAPKSPGARLREMYLQGFGVPALLAVAQDVSGNAKNIALAMAKAIGCTKAGVIETTFKDETESDLIGEQTVLVGGLMELIKKGFEVLVEAGYPPELSYFEACNEAKLIMDLIYEKGLTGMLRGVSETARYGGLTIGPKVIDDHVKENMKKIVKNVQNGKFAEEWIKISKENPKILEEKIALIENHELENVGKRIRKMSGIEK
ncbi:ketol-acid reductoisomerase [Candidatus Bathyarchaeota archaeon]|nr:ketol-acid reductoisomerase [Candidatus Bathyarchaeota archaeon]